MGILSKIRSWFNGIETAPTIMPIDEIDHPKATKEIGEQDLKAEELIEAVKVAYEEPKPDSVQFVTTQSETIPYHDSQPTQPKAEQNKRRSRKSTKSSTRSKKKVKEVAKLGA
ncbi:MAG: hypothetical protein L6N94_06065 [Candidatus Methylarchaceae archaeon HK01M]|nr:hypothetical protein [Candidatus Methylarchaceae archaeon HK01M]